MLIIYFSLRINLLDDIPIYAEIIILTILLTLSKYAIKVFLLIKLILSNNIPI